MKVKTSVTLSQEVLERVDRHVEGENNRSAFVELALKTYLELIERTRRDQDDLQVINRLSERLNQEAGEVLDYQGEL